MSRGLGDVYKRQVKIEYEATDSDGQPYRSEYWFIMDKDAQCVIRSFEIPLL